MMRPKTSRAAATADLVMILGAVAVGVVLVAKLADTERARVTLALLDKDIQGLLSDHKLLSHLARPPVERAWA